MKKLLMAIIAVVMGGFMMITPVFAECTKEQKNQGCVSTAILGDGCSCDNGGGSSIIDVLMLVINIMSIIIGILAAIGIAITGIQYLTAGGNEEKTRKAKRRLFEIVIGVAAYVLLYVFLSWLIPSFSVGN